MQVTWDAWVYVQRSSAGVLEEEDKVTSATGRNPKVDWTAKGDTEWGALKKQQKPRTEEGINWQSIRVNQAIGGQLDCGQHRNITKKKENTGSRLREGGSRLQGQW